MSADPRPAHEVWADPRSPSTAKERAELDALLGIETMVREALDADLPLADVFVRVAKTHLAALDEARAVAADRLPDPARKWRGVPSIEASVYEDGAGNSIIGSRGEWMLITENSVCGPFRRFGDAKRYMEENDV